VDEVGKVLPALFKKQMRRDEPHLLEILLPLWPRIAGKAIAQHSQPASFDGGVLTLTTDCATWGAQLRHMAEEMRKGINGFLGQPIVRKLRIKKGNPSSLFAPPTTRRGTIRTVPRPAGKMVDTAAIADREIASTLENSYAKYFTRPGREN
jgi:hypothetical protein